MAGLPLGTGSKCCSDAEARGHPSVRKGHLDRQASQVAEVSLVPGSSNRATQVEAVP